MHNFNILGLKMSISRCRSTQERVSIPQSGQNLFHFKQFSTPYLQVLDDEHTMTISAGSIVTVTVSLSRQCLRDVVDISAVEEADVQMMVSYNHHNDYHKPKISK